MTVITPISPPDARIETGNLDAQRVHAVPVIVIAPHNQCDCRCVMCDIWRIRGPEEFSVADLDRQIDSFRQLGVRWVVLTGGEPQKNSHLPTLAGKLRDEGIRVTLLTAGLLLDSQAETIVATVDDVIVSLDGPPELHNRIRRIERAFERVAAGVAELRRMRADIPVRARCTVQQLNHGALCATADSARDIGLNSVSFLAADVSSSAFNRSLAWAAERQETVALDAIEVEALEREIERLIHEHAGDLASGFIAESPEKLHRIVLHFRAYLGQLQAIAPQCNAPWVSAVVDAGGDVRPCFFHQPLGNTRHGALHEILNSVTALQFRKDLDIATNPTCRRCVCSLYIANPKTFTAGLPHSVPPNGSRSRRTEWLTE